MSEFKLPSIGEGVESADVAEILVSEGDTVEAEQALMELETEKAVVELPAPHAGKITKIHVSAGDAITVGQLILEIENGEADVATDSEDSSAQDSSAPDASVVSEQSSGETMNQEESQDSSFRNDDQTGEPTTHEFKLPSIGEGVETADVAEIRVAEGDTIDAEQIVMELETEKAVVELPCPYAGTISTVHVAAGETISVGQMVLTIEGTAESESGSKPQKKQKEEKPQQKSAASAKPQAGGDRGTPAQPGEQQPTDEPFREAPETTRAVTAELVAANGENGTPVPAAPSTRRMARELGVDLHRVSGSGPGGRITHEDVQAYVKQRMTGQRGGLTTQGSGGGVSIGLAPPPLPDFSTYGVIEREKLNKLGRTAAENLTVSWNVIPHVTQHDRADITDLEAARKTFVKGIGQDGPKVTMTALAIKALTVALQQFPKCNSSLDPETMEIVYKRYYNIGCAVDTPHGLVVPVVKECDQKSIVEIAADLTEVAEKARDRKLSMDQMQGATCTVTNLGGIGGVGFTPIVNYPEVCILGMARGQQELQLLDDGELSQRMMLPLSLSYDHRVINGADAARFLVTICRLLEDPFHLLAMS